MVNAKSQSLAPAGRQAGMCRRRQGDALFFRRLEEASTLEGSRAIFMAWFLPSRLLLVHVSGQEKAVGGDVCCRLRLGKAGVAQ